MVVRFWDLSGMPMSEYQHLEDISDIIQTQRRPTTSRTVK